jgi:hypothetical protein
MEAMLPGPVHSLTHLLLSDTQSSIYLARLRTSRLLSAAALCQAVLACREWTLLLLVLLLLPLLLLPLSKMLLLGLLPVPTAADSVPSTAPAACCAVAAGGSSCCCWCWCLLLNCDVLVSMLLLLLLLLLGS